MQLSRVLPVSLVLIVSQNLLAQSSKESAISPARSIAGAPQPQKMMPMNTQLVAPLVIESSDWSSVVTLVNEGKSQVHAQLSLRSPSSELMASGVVAIPGHSSRRVEMSTLFGRAAVDFIGSLSVKIEEAEAAENMAVAAQLTLIGRGPYTGNSIDQELEMPIMGSNFKSVTDTSSTLLAVQNTGMETASVALTCLVQGSTNVTTVHVPANSLRLFPPC